MRWLWQMGFYLLAGAAAAQAPLMSLRPLPRPFIIATAPSALLAPLSSPRPRARLDNATVVSVISAVVAEHAIQDDIVQVQKVKNTVTARIQNTRAASVARRGYSRVAVARSLRPQKRPKLLKLASIDPAPYQAGQAVRYRKKGSVCGIKGIRGYSVGRVQGKISGCTIKDPVRIREVDGVLLTREVLLGCEAARSLYSWVRKSAKPAVGRKGGGLGKIQTIAGYSCRNRNSAKNGKLSEHAKGKALDIAGFVLKNGTVLSVKKDWRTGSKGPTLKKLHKTACGPFGTVLGPNANKYHYDHFHFDVARYRSRTYCR